MAMGDFNTAPAAAPHAAPRLERPRRAPATRGPAPERHVAVIANKKASRWRTRSSKTSRSRPRKWPPRRLRRGEDFDYWQRPDRRIDTAPLPSSGAPMPSARSTTTRGPESRGHHRREPVLLQLLQVAESAPPGGELDSARTFATGQIVLVIMLVQSTVFALILILAPLLRLRRRPGGRAAPDRVRPVLRRARSRLHPARDQLHPALRALSRLSDLRALRGVVLAALPSPGSGASSPSAFSHHPTSACCQSCWAP